MIDNDFDHFYQEKILPALEPLETTRKSIKKTYIIGGTTALVSAGISFAMTSSVVFVVISLVVVLGLVALITYSSKKNYRSTFKNTVVRRIVEFYNPDWQYRPNGGIPQHDFKASRIFLTDIDRYKCEDMIKGALGSTVFHFSEVHAEYKTTTTDSKGRTQTHWHTIFKGIFFKADFNKDFKGHTVVLPDTAEKTFGFLGKFFQKHSFRKEDLVNMEDPNFEKEFVVYSTNQVEARYLLTPALMQRFTNFKNKLREKKFYASFQNTHINIAIPYAKNFFEPTLWNTLFQPKRYENFFDELGFFTSIVDEMNLNTRIWTKE